MEIVNKALLSFSPEKKSRAPPSHTPFEETVLAKDNVLASPGTVSAPQVLEAQRPVKSPGAVPPEDYAMLHTVAQPYVGHEEEQRGTEFQAPEEPRILPAQVEGAAILHSQHLSPAAQGHVGEKRAASVDLETKAEDSEPAIAMRQQEPLQPETPPSAPRATTPERILPGGEDTNSPFDENESSLDPAAYASAMAPFAETEREIHTQDQQERITLHNLEGLEKKQGMPVSDIAHPVSAADVFTDIAALKDKDHATDFVISTRVYHQFGQPLKHVEEVKKQASELQAIYGKEATMPTPASLRKAGEEEEEAPFLSKHDAVQLDTVDEGLIDDAVRAEGESEQQLEFERAEKVRRAPAAAVSAIVAASPQLPPRAARPAAMLSPSSTLSRTRNMVAGWTTQLWQEFDVESQLESLPALFLSLLQTVFVVLLAAVYASGQLIEQGLKANESRVPATRVVTQQLSEREMDKPDSATPSLPPLAAAAQEPRASSEFEVGKTPGFVTARSEGGAQSRVVGPEEIMQEESTKESSNITPPHQRPSPHVTFALPAEVEEEQRIEAKEQGRTEAPADSQKGTLFATATTEHAGGMPPKEAHLNIMPGRSALKGRATVEPEPEAPLGVVPSPIQRTTAEVGEAASSQEMKANVSKDVNTSRYVEPGPLEAATTAPATEAETVKTKIKMKKKNRGRLRGPLHKLAKMLKIA